MNMKTIKAFLLAIVIFGSVDATIPEYASRKWWDEFWETTDGWGQPNDRVLTLYEFLDGSKPEVTIVDIGSGNGRNSVLALMELFKDRNPQSTYVVHCYDTSVSALSGLQKLNLPDWLKLETHTDNVNKFNRSTLPESDVALLYGILEYVNDVRLENVIDYAGQSVKTDGYLMVVTLVEGEGAVVIEGEATRKTQEYTQRLSKLLRPFAFVDFPSVELKHDRHDIGRGYPEDHLHHVYRTLLVKVR